MKPRDTPSKDLGTLSIQIASVPDRENVVAEIWEGNELVAELNMERDGIEIQIYARSSGEPWVFALQEFSSALHRAARDLIPGEGE